jgi:hypothetical protein
MDRAVTAAAGDHCQLRLVVEHRRDGVDTDGVRGD